MVVRIGVAPADATYLMFDPEIDIQVGDSLEVAETKVSDAYRKGGADVLSYDNLNSFLPVSNYCHFYQASSEEGEAVLIVMVDEWDERSTLTILNVLLEIRMDPDPPGRAPLFRFYSAREVPPILLTLFGPSAVSRLECRAMLVAQFGKDVEAGNAMQFAASALFLLREVLGVESDFYDAQGPEKLGAVIVDQLRGAGFPSEGAPLNSLIIIGFLYGEQIRHQLEYASVWGRLDDDRSPWPRLIIGATRPDGSPASGADPRVVFNPISTAITLFREGESGALRATLDALRERLIAELQVSAEGGPGSASP